jgi:hypothetical protein
MLSSLDHVLALISLFSPQFKVEALPLKQIPWAHDFSDFSFKFPFPGPKNQMPHFLDKA